jgi:hypothetical protein
MLRSRKKKKKKGPAGLFHRSCHLLTFRVPTFKRRALSRHDHVDSFVFFIYFFFSIEIYFFPPLVLKPFFLLFILDESFDISSRTGWRRRCVCSCLIRRFDRMYFALLPLDWYSVAVILLPSTDPFLSRFLEGHQGETIENVLYRAVYYICTRNTYVDECSIYPYPCRRKRKQLEDE